VTPGPLEGQVAVVTGGGRGIGRAVAVALARQGASVAVGYRERSADADETLRQVQEAGAQGIAVAGDVSRRADVERLIGAALEAYGRIDVLVTSAGVLQQKPFAEITADDWDHVMDVNLKGTFLCCQQALAVMARQRSGRMITIASSGAQLGGTLGPHYAASKAGVISLTRSLARLGAPDVAVNCIAPGLIETEMTQEEIASTEGQEKIRQILLERAGTAEEVADAAVFLATSAGYMTGQTINVNGGLYLG
jgi:3-oxoacyl-[acyl-carrier protein] reductase